MTVTVPLGRVLSRQRVFRSNHLLTRLASNSQHCASYDNPRSQSALPVCHELLHRVVGACPARSYATAVARKPAGRPKAHTGRGTAKTPRTKPSPTSGKKKSASRAGAKTKPKVKARPRSKPGKKVARPLSKTAINRARIDRTKDLRERALLTEPKRLPASAWAVYFARHQKGAANIAEGQERTRESARNYKQLSPEEREELNHTANQNKAKNDGEYKKWLLEHTPIEIKDANNARKLLNSEKKSKDGKKRSPIPVIKDERLVRQPITSYAFFVRERHASGDFKHMTIAESARLIGREWKALSASEKQPFEDQFKAESDRYVEEHTSVYGKQPANHKTN